MTDPAVHFVLDALAEHFHELNDNDEDAPFGCYANVEWDRAGHVMVVSPDQDPDNWAERDDNGEIETDGVVPAGPVVRVTVERIDT